MYCFLCQDFIYDPFIEKTRVTKQAELMEGNSGSTFSYQHLSLGGGMSFIFEMQSLGLLSFTIGGLYAHTCHSPEKAQT